MSPSRRRKRGAPARARALALLAAAPGPMSVTKVAAALFPERFAASKEGARTDAGIHLAELKRQGLVRRRLVDGVQVWEAVTPGGPATPAEPAEDTSA
jgi:hypothetical protein